MKLENFYAHVKVGIADKELKDRLQSLLDDVVSRLPDEKQFQTRGIIGFAKVTKGEKIKKIWNSFSPTDVLGKKSTCVYSHCEIFATKTGDIHSYLIFDITNLLDPKFWLHYKINYPSDDHIKGLIIHVISHMSYSWNLLQQEKPNLITLSPKEKEVRINQILGKDLKRLSYKWFELEAKVNAEAIRLGFEKEILAQFGKGVVYDKKEKCWRVVR